MKHTRIATTVQRGHLPLLVRRQIAALLSRVKDGSDIVIELYQRPVRRTAAQNDFFHAAIMPWAREEGHRIDDLKRDLLGIVFGWEDSPLREARVPKKPHTSQLTKEEFSELVERTVEIAAECGVVLQLPDEYRASRWMPESMRRSA
jgi:antitoxin (DNA-binding transcriptional repressor) of toxin-antitoxin stability system